MLVLVKTLQKSDFVLDNVSEDCTIEELFRMVSQKTGVAWNQVRLIYKNKKLNEWETSKLVKNYVDIKENPITLYYTLRLGENMLSNFSVTCPVCLNKGNQYVHVSKPCRHVICNQCFVGLIRTNQNKRCVICRQLVESYVSPSNFQPHVPLFI